MCPLLQCWVRMSLELCYLIVVIKVLRLKARRLWVHFQLRSLCEMSVCGHVYTRRLRLQLGLGFG